MLTDPKKQRNTTHDEESASNTMVKTIILGDKCPTESNQPLTVMVKHYVRPDKLDAFAQWCRQMQKLSRRFEGYIDTEIIRPTCVDESDEYVAIFRYDNYQHLKAWMESTERKTMIDRITEFSSANSVVYAFHSLEHWFSASNDKDGEENNPSHTSDKKKKAGGGPPPKYKMVVVTTAVIYTQTLWVPKVLNKLLGHANLHPDVMGFLTVLCIVLLATYAIFPVVTRLVAFWLFPTANYRDKIMELVPSVLLSWLHNSEKNGLNDTVASTNKGKDPTLHQDSLSSDSTTVKRGDNDSERVRQMGDIDV